MPRGELHIQLACDYADDEKFAEVSRSARLLYVDALCLAKRLLNDGTISRAQLDKLMYPERPAAVKRAAAELVDAKLWEWDDGRKVYVISAWLKRNKSRAQVADDRRIAEEAAALGNHRRWHDGRDKRDPKCKHCIEEAA
jgi:hypothetical protein